MDVPDPQPSELFDPRQLTPAMHELLGDGIAEVLLAAHRGDRDQLHEAERNWANRAIRALDIRLELIGLERIDVAGNYVVIPLHEGFADVLALLRLPLDLSWVIRDELLALPFFGDYLQAAGHIAIEPEAPRTAWKRVLLQASERLENGESVVIFPQGSLLGVETAFQPGAFRLAARVGRPVLPVVLTGTHQVWDYPFSSQLRTGQSVRLEVLEPLHAGEFDPRDLERDMKRRALAVTRAPVRHYVPERDGLWEGFRFSIDPDFPDTAAAAGRPVT